MRRKEVEVNSKLPRIKKTRDELMRDEELKRYARQRENSARNKSKKSMKRQNSRRNDIENYNPEVEDTPAVTVSKDNRPIKSSLKKKPSQLSNEQSYTERVTNSKYPMPSITQDKSRALTRAEAISQTARSYSRLKTQKEVTEKANYVIPDPANKRSIPSARRIEKGEKEIPNKPWNIRYVAPKSNIDLQPEEY